MAESKSIKETLLELIEKGDLCGIKELISTKQLRELVANGELSEIEEELREKIYCLGTYIEDMEYMNESTKENYSKDNKLLELESERDFLLKVTSLFGDYDEEIERQCTLLKRSERKYPGDKKARLLYLVVRGVEVEFEGKNYEDSNELLIGFCEAGCDLGVIAHYILKFKEIDYKKLDAGELDVLCTRGFLKSVGTIIKHCLGKGMEPTDIFEKFVQPIVETLTACTVIQNGAAEPKKIVPFSNLEFVKVITTFFTNILLTNGVEFAKVKECLAHFAEYIWSNVQGKCSAETIYHWHDGKSPLVGETTEKFIAGFIEACIDNEISCENFEDAIKCFAETIRSKCADTEFIEDEFLYFINNLVLESVCSALKINVFDILPKNSTETTVTTVTTEAEEKLTEEEKKERSRIKFLENQIPFLLCIWRFEQKLDPETMKKIDDTVKLVYSQAVLKQREEKQREEEIKDQKVLKTVGDFLTELETEEQKQYRNLLGENLEAAADLFRLVEKEKGCCLAK